MIVVKGENGERDQCNMKVLNYSSCNGRLHVYGPKWFSPRWPKRFILTREMENEESVMCIERPLSPFYARDMMESNKVYVGGNMKR